MKLLLLCSLCVHIHILTCSFLCCGKKKPVKTPLQVIAIETNAKKTVLDQEMCSSKALTKQEWEVIAREIKRLEALDISMSTDSPVPDTPSTPSKHDTE